MLRLFVLGQIGEMRLSGTSGIVLKAKELFERVPIEEKWRLPDDSYAEDSFFDKVAAFQRFSR